MILFFASLGLSFERKILLILLEKEGERIYCSIDTAKPDLRTYSLGKHAINATNELLRHTQSEWKG